MWNSRLHLGTTTTRGLYRFWRLMVVAFFWYKVGCLRCLALAIPLLVDRFFTHLLCSLISAVLIPYSTSHYVLRLPNSKTETATSEITYTHPNKRGYVVYRIPARALTSCGCAGCALGGQGA
ncbi:hypothetical protein B0H34DRAFT_701462 [Crassisporium funariophilum]|nr:hypothetical protein B0H34DRAFT_701462 [Crassisporium funariophilum]